MITTEFQKLPEIYEIGSDFKKYRVDSWTKKDMSKKDMY